MEFFTFKKNHVIGLLVSVAMFAIIAVVYTQTKILDGIEWSATDFRFFLRDPSQKSKTLQEGVRRYVPNPRARKDIIIVGIDENTIRDFSDQKISWPFPWDTHAQFVRYVGSGEPAAVFFDIMFLDHKKGEDALAKAIVGAKNVFLDYPMETEAVDQKYADIAERLEYLDKVRFPVDPKDKTLPIVEEAVPPTPLLAKSARGIGFANIFPARDNINRTVPLLLKFKGWYYPNIDMVLIMHYYGLGVNDVEIKWGKYIKLKNVPREKMAKPNPQREIIIPIDELGFMDINFIGGSGSFQHYSYQLFSREGSMAGNTSIKDKIILVAAYASTGIATDEKQSPYGATFGIEHHANALNTILKQDFLVRLTDIQNLVILFFIAIILGLLLPRLSIIASLVFTGIFALVYLVGNYLLFDLTSHIVTLSTPMIQTIFTFTLVIVYRVLTEQREKKYIRQTFSKFVSKSVVDELLKHPEKLKLGGEKKVLTVLFSDIRGFTSLSEKLPAEAMVEHLNVYLQAMTDIIHQYDGTLDKYVGDEIMAFWGAPIPQEDHALLACRTAIDMMAKLDAMNREWAAQAKEPLHIGVGINTGDMVVGNMGSLSRMDYTLMGDMVNLGARLEGTNKVYGTGIIISEFTYEHVKEHIVARELDLIKVKGKEKPVKIYELMDVR